MKNAFYFVLMISVMIVCMACSKSTSQQKESSDIKAGTVEVYYFHFERRCASCIALENVTKQIIETEYADQIKDGKLVFKVFNLDKKETEPVSEKFMIVMPTLLIVKGEQKKDLTDIGFRYASSEPEKFKQELQSAIDSLLKG